MKRLVILVCLLFLGACEGTVLLDDPQSMFDDGVGATPDRGAAATAGAGSGAELYQQNCAACHGAQAEGTAVWPSNIQGYAPIEPIVTNGRGTMPVLALPTEDVQKIQEFLTSLAAPAEQLDGEGLFGRYCASCHGADASGAAEWAGSIQAYEGIAPLVEQGRGNMDPIPVTPEQTQLIQDWLLTLAPPLSSLNGEEVYERLCVACHGTQGEGIDTTGPQLRYDDRSFSRYWTRAGRGTSSYDADMPSYPTDMISDAQLDELFEFIDRSQRPATGEGLFTQYCANCHGADATGGASGQSIRSDDSFVGVSREGKGGTDYNVRRSYMSSWSSAQLSDSEIQMISSYVGSL